MIREKKYFLKIIAQPSSPHLPQLPANAKGSQGTPGLRVRSHLNRGTGVPLNTVSSTKDQHLQKGQRAVLHFLMLTPRVRTTLITDTTDTFIPQSLPSEILHTLRIHGVS